MSRAWQLSISVYRDSLFMTQLLLNITPDRLPTLNNFVPGGNVELLSALQHAVAETSNERCFYLWGEMGCGKSHLMQAFTGALLGL